MKKCDFERKRWLGFELLLGNSDFGGKFSGFKRPRFSTKMLIGQTSKSNSSKRTTWSDGDGLEKRLRISNLGPIRSFACILQRCNNPKIFKIECEEIWLATNVTRSTREVVQKGEIVLYGDAEATTSGVDGCVGGGA